MSNSSIWPIDRALSGATTPARVDYGTMAMKGYSAFLKLQHFWRPTIRLFRIISGHSLGRGLTPFRESLYSTAPANWAENIRWAQHLTVLCNSSPFGAAEMCKIFDPPKYFITNNRTLAYDFNLFDFKKFKTISIQWFFFFFKHPYLWYFYSNVFTDVIIHRITFRD